MLERDSELDTAILLPLSLIATPLPNSSYLCPNVVSFAVCVASAQPEEGFVNTYAAPFASAEVICESVLVPLNHATGAPATTVDPSSEMSKPLDPSRCCVNRPVTDNLTGVSVPAVLAQPPAGLANMYT